MKPSQNTTLTPYKCEVRCHAKRKLECYVKFCKYLRTLKIAEERNSVSSKNFHQKRNIKEDVGLRLLFLEENIFTCMVMLRILKIENDKNCSLKIGMFKG